MEKKEFQQLFRTQMKELGFKVKGNYSYKIIDDDYLIGVFLDHYSYANAYHIYYGVIYCFDENKLPFKGVCDWDDCFWFTVDPEDDLKNYPIEKYFTRFDRKKVVEYFEYDTRTKEDFLKCFHINVEKRLKHVFCKEYVLDIYRKDWVEFRQIPYDTVRKISKLAGLDVDKVISFRDD